MGLGVMMAGLFAGTGVGLVVLFRMNDNKKENAKILLLLYATGEYLPHSSALKRRIKYERFFLFVLSF